MDGEDETPTKIIVESALRTAAHQPRFLQILGRVAALLQPPRELLSSLFGETEAELRDGFIGHPALRQIAARFRAGRRSQICLEYFPRDFMHLRDRRPQLFFRIGSQGALGHRNPVAFGQEFQRFIEGDALNLHYEFEDIAACAAAEAFIKLVAGVNRK